MGLKYLCNDELGGDRVSVDSAGVKLNQGCRRFARVHIGLGLGKGHTAWPRMAVPQGPGAQPLATKLGINQESCSTERRRVSSVRLFPQDADPRRIVNLSKSERGVRACEECRQDAGATKRLEGRGGEQTGWPLLDSRTTVVIVAAIAGVVNKIKYTEG